MAWVHVKEDGTGPQHVDDVALPVHLHIPPRLVHRPRVEDLITRALRRQLIFVTAPAGYGKSAAVTDWIQHHPKTPFFWESSRIFAEEARELREALCESVWFLARTQKSQELEAGPKLTPVADLEPEILIIVDDEEGGRWISDSSGVTSLLEQLPIEAHLLVVSRSRPPAGLHEFRPAGELSEITAQDLAFTPEEAAVLIQECSGLSLESDEIEGLVSSTEGWAVGLLLAASKCQELRDFWSEPDVLASDELIGEYFEQEILNQLSADLKEFLFSISTLSVITPEASEAVSNRDNAHAVDCLDQLRSLNLFIDRSVVVPSTIPAIRARTMVPELGSLLTIGHHYISYRLHRLFAAYLRTRLETMHPDVYRETNLRAARWYQEEGELSQALRHLAEAHDTEGEFDLAAQVLIESCDRSPVPLVDIAPHLTHKPREVMNQEETFQYRAVVRMIVRVLAASTKLRSQEMMICIRWLERTRLSDGRESTWLSYLIEELWAIHDLLVGDAAGIMLHSSHMISWSATSTGAPDAPVKILEMYPWFERLQQILRKFAVVARAHAFLWFGDSASAQGEIAESPTGPLWMDSVVVPALLGRIASAEGRLQEAHGYARQALDSAFELQIEQQGPCLSAHLVLASVHYYRNELEESASILQQANEAFQFLLPPWAVLKIQLLRVLLALANGDSAAAGRLIADLQAENNRSPFPIHIRTFLYGIQIRWRLATRDYEGVWDCLEEMNGQELPPMLAARVDLFAGRPEHAITQLSAMSEGNLTLLHNLERLILLGRAYSMTGSERRARDYIRRATQLARPENHVRLFLDDGSELEPILRSLRELHPDPFLDRVIEANVPPMPATKIQPAITLISPLTNRERAVLARLPTYLSQEQIAGELFISLNTLKTHLKSLYRKLGVSSRADAIAIAHSHGLL